LGVALGLAALVGAVAGDFAGMLGGGKRLRGLGYWGDRCGWEGAASREGRSGGVVDRGDAEAERGG
jgi:hypothetical protein